VAKALEEEGTRGGSTLFFNMRGEASDRDIHVTLMQAEWALKKAPIHVDGTGGLTVEELCERARKTKVKHAGLALVVVDYLQLLRSGGPDATGQDYGKIAYALKALAVDLGIIVFATSELCRKQETSMLPLAVPELLERHTDVVCVLRRNAGKEGDSVMVDVLKNRQGPTVCGVSLLMDDWPGCDCGMV
jgi:replicative DNA helicase